MSFSGAFDVKHRNGRLTIDASALGTAGTSAKIQFLLVNSVAYFSLDSFKGLTPGTLPSSLSGKKWLKLDLKAFGASASQLNQANPSSSLDTLRGVTSDVQNLGSDTVGGASTTHYRIHIDLAKAVQNAPAAQRTQIQRSIDALGGSGILPADIWIDRQGRPRKLSLSFTAKTATTTTSASESFEFSDFGAGVSITAPPANQVADRSQLLSAAGESKAAEPGGLSQGRARCRNGRSARHGRRRGVRVPRCAVNPWRAGTCEGGGSLAGGAGGADDGDGQGARL